MNKVSEIITTLSDFLEKTHSDLDKWFEVENSLGVFKPVPIAWSIFEILEHISLTSHYLLIIIAKATDKALRNVQNRDLATELQNYTLLRPALDEIGVLGSFAWVRPLHMEPTGKVALAAVRATIQTQLTECKQLLTRLNDGQGVLYQTTMSVNNLGKLDVYQYLYFLAQHIQRHIQQMQRNQRQFYAQHSKNN
jgi:hypothetical protein